MSVFNRGTNIIIQADPSFSVIQAIDAADRAIAAASGITTPYDTRDAFLAAQIAPVVTRARFYVNGETYAVVRDGSGPIVQSNGQTWRPDGDVTPQHFGAVGDGVADDRAAFVAADSYGGLVFVPAPPVSYNLSSAYQSVNATFKFDQSGDWEGLTDTGLFNASLSFFADEGNGVSVERFPGRVFVGATAAETTANKVPGVNKSWVGESAGGFMTYFESRGTVSVAGLGGGVAVAGSSRSSDNTRLGEVNTIGGGFYAKNDNTNAADKKSAWAIYGHASQLEANKFTTSLELDTCSLQPLIGAGPYQMGVEGTTATAWLGVGGETAQQLVDTGLGATLREVSVAIGVVNTASAAAQNRYAKGLVFQATALTGTDGDGTGTGVAIEMARGHQINWKFSSGANAFSGAIRADGGVAETQQRLVMTAGAFQVRGVQSDLTTEQPLFSVVAPSMGAAAVNYISMSPGAAAGGTTTIQAAGPDTNVDIRILPKGAGLVRFGNSTAAAATPASFSANRYLAIKDASGTTYYVPCSAVTW